jgi:hypothetical protein
MKRLPLLDNLRVDAPCDADWDAMRGDERVRFCGQCETNVYDLSAMPPREAEALVRAKQGRMCVRFIAAAAAALTIVAGASAHADLSINEGKQGKKRPAPTEKLMGKLAAPPPEVIQGQLIMNDPVAPPVKK